MANAVKLNFQLSEDDDGYPPVAVESVWAEPLGESGNYKIDNVPFFASEATLGDVVSGRSDEHGNVWFQNLVRDGGNSLIRVVFFDRSALSRIEQHLRSLGCATEYEKTHNLLGVSIPKAVPLDAVQSYLAGEAESGAVDYEEPILRQGT